MAKIICEKCGSEYKYAIAKNFKCCPVCGASMLDNNDFVHENPIENYSNLIENESTTEKMTYYYYDNGTLAPVLYHHWKPLYTFEAIDKKDAERQLKKLCPNSPVFKNSPSSSSIIQCPYCMSREYTLMNKGFSIFTGFLGSSKVKRVCNYCKKEF